MSKIALIAILIIVVVAGFGVLYLQGYLGGSSMAPVSTGVSDPREENSTTTSAADSGAAVQPKDGAPSQPAAAGSDADASADTSMDADMQSIDTQMQGLDSDNTSLDASANDEPISQ